MVYDAVAVELPKLRSGSYFPDWLLETASPDLLREMVKVFALQTVLHPSDHVVVQTQGQRPSRLLLRQSG